MNVRYDIETKGRNRLVTVWEADPGQPAAFLKYAARLLSTASNLNEVFLYDSDSVSCKCTAEGLSREIRATGGVTLIQPTSWENLGRILDRLRAARYTRFVVFSAATPACAPKPTARLFSGGLYWFKRHLRELKWWCVFITDIEPGPIMELWAAWGVSDACEKLAETLRLEASRSSDGKR